MYTHRPILTTISFAKSLDIYEANNREISKEGHVKEKRNNVRDLGGKCSLIGREPSEVANIYEVHHTTRVAQGMCTHEIGKFFRLSCDDIFLEDDASRRVKNTL